jgi:hypothetical protein
MKILKRNSETVHGAQTADQNGQSEHHTHFVPSEIDSSREGFLIHLLKFNLPYFNTFSVFL